MKKKLIIAIILVVIVFLIYKIVKLNEYKSEQVEFDSNAIFNERLTIPEEEENSEDTLTYEKLTIKNYFSDYVDNKNGGDIKVKYDENDEPISFYYITVVKQYIKTLNVDALIIGSDFEEHKNGTPDPDVENFLTKNNINDDIDFFNYLKDNYYFKNNIFTNTKTMKVNHILNTFVSDSIPSFKSITLFDGHVLGYIINNQTNSEKPIREIHLLKDDNQYIITLGGQDLTSDDFTLELLKTVKFA